MTKRVKHRAQHIVEVLAFAPILFTLEWILRSLNGVQPDHNEPFYKFVWSMMWQDEITKDD